MLKPLSKLFHTAPSGRSWQYPPLCKWQPDARSMFCTPSCRPSQLLRDGVRHISKVIHWFRAGDTFAILSTHFHYSFQNRNNNHQSNSAFFRALFQVFRALPLGWAHSSNPRRQMAKNDWFSQKWLWALPLSCLSPRPGKHQIRPQCRSYTRRNQENISIKKENHWWLLYDWKRY